MDCDQITLKQQQMVKTHLKKSTKLDQMQSISKAGFGLYKFLLAVLDYCTVYREVITRAIFSTVKSQNVYSISHKYQLYLSPLSKVTER